LTLHAEKALNKKIWYLRDQGTVATTNPAVHQTGLQALMTGQKDHPRQEEIPHPAMIDRISTNQIKNIKVTARAKRNHFLHPTANQGRPVIIHQALVAAPAKRNHFHHAANHIQAARQIMTTVRKEVLVASHQAENHLQGEKHPIQAG
jgi:hypothetical protein